MDDPLQVVLANPHSVRARRALAEFWSLKGDPRARLIALQLEAHDGYDEEGWTRTDEIRDLIERHGRRWAGRVAEICEWYRYELGMVAGVSLRGDMFVEHARELMSLAPIVHLYLGLPIDIEKLCATPELGQISTLVTDGGDWVTDRAAEVLAASPYARQLRIVTLCGGSMTERGVLALANSPNLKDVVSIELSGNPCEREAVGARTLRNGDQFFLIGDAAEPHLRGGTSKGGLELRPDGTDRVAAAAGRRGLHGVMRGEQLPCRTRMTDPLLHVLSNPHSVRARRQLAEFWEKAACLQGRLIRLQLEEYEGYLDEDWSRSDEILDLIEKHGREWAGRIAELTRTYRFELGLVASITIESEVFLEHADEIVTTAPVVHLSLVGPVDMQRLVAVPAFAQLSTLRMRGGEWLDDAAVEVLAEARTARRLRAVELCGGNITGRGLDALARSPNLRDVAYIDLTGNPCEDGEHQTQAYRINKRYYVIGDAGLPYLEGARRAAIRSYDPMSLVYWPPLAELFAYEE